MSSASHIEINGKKYDAHTGKLIVGASKTQPAKPKHHSVQTPRVSDVKRSMHTPSKRIHTTAERSKTLMRHAVKRPAKLVGAKPQATASMLDVAAPITTARSPVSMYHNADPAREARAHKIKRSQLVSKFSDMSIPSLQVKTRVEALPVAAAPVANRAKKPAQTQAASVIERGLQNAQSHKQAAHHASHPKSRRKHGRMVTAVTTGLSILLLGTFITYQNVPNISMRYAASRAGVSAQLPSYQPSGFSMNNRIKYMPGQITMSFTSNTDEREFTITQRDSAWVWYNY